MNQGKRKRTVCKLKSDTEELCVPCHIAESIIAFTAIKDAHPDQIDTSFITRLENDPASAPEELEDYLDKIEEMKASARDEAANEAEMVTGHLYSLICEDEPKTD